MTKQRLPPDDPREWLNRARSNPALASQRIPGGYLVSPQTLAESGAKSGSVLGAQAHLVAHDACKDCSGGPRGSHREGIGLALWRGSGSGENHETLGEAGTF